MTRPVHRVAPATDTPVRQDSLRAHNLILTFRQIVGARRAPLSRIELATATGLTRPTISRIVDELLSAGLIVEAEPARSGSSGRPRVGLSLARTGPAGLGLDIRDDTVSVCVVDLTGTVRHLAFAAHTGSASDPAATLRNLAGLADGAIRAARAEDLTVVGATLAAPGPVDAGVVRFAPALGWRDVDASSALRALLQADFPVRVENDAGLAALAELYAGGPELRDFVCVSGEFDIGAGLVLGGMPLRGSKGWGGELGHVMVDSAGPPCACSASGCLQCFAGLRQILGSADSGGSAGSFGDMPPAVAIDALASAGSPEILAALDQAAVTLGTALSTLINLVNVDVVLLGGGYSIFPSWLTDGIQRELNNRVLTSRWSPIEVRPSLLGPDAAVIGAALSSVDEVRRDPNRWLAAARPAVSTRTARPRNPSPAG
ncbi:ROK family transcriptional regulator [Actinoplanes couchii]|uniref:Sugar kinase n=1 Tax=Actinoplanes couchii TaxID=403638 RepID=A0ABQ3XP60_9ACTN|nr:ROK family transcriptional regulator [Actinoplanes couchii]MDR6315902.1 putative NBD/HSP70 family sugar kinase [Actinoplanes couchii]GID60301.1 sugar kinase [Actinoplanes couchii]